MIEQRGDTVIVSGAQMLAAAYRAVLHAIARRRLDGLPSADLQQLARALRRAHEVSLGRRELAEAAADQPELNRQDLSDRFSTGEAAAILQLSRRQVQRLAAGPGGLSGVRIGRAWLLDRAPVLTLAAERKVAS